MNHFKQAAVVILGSIITGLMIFSAATISLFILGMGAVLAVIAFLAQPFLPKATAENGIIDVEPISSKVE